MSIRSKMSMTSSVRRRQLSMPADMTGVGEPIPEEDEIGPQRMLKLVDKDGKTIELSAE